MNKESRFLSLTENNIKQLVANFLAESLKLLNVESELKHTICSQVTQYQWDFQKFYEVIFDNEHCEEKFRQVLSSRIVSPNDNIKIIDNHLFGGERERIIVPENSNPNVDESKGVKFCSICLNEYDSFTQGKRLILCGHEFCEDCWKEYLDLETKEMNLVIKCPADKCETIVDQIAVAKLLENAQQLSNYLNQLENSFERFIKCFRCPNNCGKTIVKISETGDFIFERRKKYSLQTDEEEEEITKCDCGQVLCFKCGEKDHRPLTCYQRCFIPENDPDTLSRLTVIETTKPCPNCKFPIEKNQGCNHMNCSNCRCDFCYTCGVPLFDKINEHVSKCRAPYKPTPPTDLEIIYSERRFSEEKDTINKIRDGKRDLYSKNSYYFELLIECRSICKNCFQFKTLIDSSICVNQTELELFSFRMSEFKEKTDMLAYHLLNDQNMNEVRRLADSLVLEKEPLLGESKKIISDEHSQRAQWVN